MNEKEQCNQNRVKPTNENEKVIRLGKEHPLRINNRFLEACECAQIYLDQGTRNIRRPKDYVVYVKCFFQCSIITKKQYKIHKFQKNTKQSTIREYQRRLDTYLQTIYQ